MIPFRPQHSVWPTSVPPVCHMNWDQESWDKFADASKPLGYTGDRFDEIAWSAYAAEADERERRRLYAGFGMEHVCQPLEANLAAIRKFEEREYAKG